MNGTDIIEQAESNNRGDPGSVVQDTFCAVAAELERLRTRSGENYASAYESYSVLMKALEDRTAVEKDLKDAVKQLWDGVKREDGPTTGAYLREIGRVARESAMAWIRVAAIAEKAIGSI